MNSDDTWTMQAASAPDRRMIVNIPHAGTLVPDDIGRNFASPEIASLPMTDWHVDELYSFLPDMGVDTLAARYSRFVVDLNRPPVAQALYPGRFETSLVATQTFGGEQIYSQPPDKAEVTRRRQVFHAPYHDRLLALIEEKLERLGGGAIVLIDAHSVASGANRLHDALGDHIYLGDRDGRTCPAWVTDEVERLFHERGYRVRRNEPYKGGYVTSHYGGFDNVFALQIEMCQRVYMDESDPAAALDNPLFGKTRDALKSLFAELLDIIDQRLV